MQAVSELVETGELSAADAAELHEEINDCKKGGKKVQSALIIRKVNTHKCGICRQAGHNRRTCPKK